MKIAKKIAIVVFVFSVASCGTMRDVSIYEPSKSVSPFEQFPYKILFNDSKENGLWGVKTNACKQVSYKNNNSYVGEDHLHIKWNESDCKYVAIGLKWSNYKVKNLKPILESTAIELRVRIDSGTLSNVPMFFVLVDYGGKQCRANINYLDLEEGKIDTVWRRIQIPLQAFNYEKKGVNMSNIKELRLEFQRKGDLHIDNIKIVPYNYNYIKSKDKFTKSFDSHPQDLGVGKEYWWGINTKYSSSLKFGNSFKNESVVVDYPESKDLKWNTFGFSPYQWMHLDISSIYRTSAIKFKIKANELPKLKVFLFSYKGKKRRLQIVLNDNNFINRGDGIYDAYLPLKSLEEHEKFTWQSFKEIRFKVLSGNQFEVGNFQLIEFRGNPQKPTQWKGI